jgi:hypothetical protein
MNIVLHNNVGYVHHGIYTMALTSLSIRHICHMIPTPTSGATLARRPDLRQGPRSLLARRQIYANGCRWARKGYANDIAGPKAVGYADGPDIKPSA